MESQIVRTNHRWRNSSSFACGFGVALAAENTHIEHLFGDEHFAWKQARCMLGMIMLIAAQNTAQHVVQVCDIAHILVHNVLTPYLDCPRLRWIQPKHTLQTRLRVAPLLQVDAIGLYLNNNDAREESD